MNAGCGAPVDATLSAPASGARGSDAARWAIGTLGAILLLHHATLWTMVQVWARSQTFAHGFVIVPISAWLAWRDRARLASIDTRPSASGLALLLLLNAVWLLAYAADAPVLAEYAVMAMIGAAVIATLGWPMARALGFPLAYLLLAVPFGEVFIPPLIDFTARFTVGALQLTGIPVFRENNYFSIPSGNWSVIEACSGLRYVIASTALGTLYAYLNYHSLRRRLLFIGVALLLPILANGLRAYMIVMIGHWSNMRLAVGIDHLIYGWLFFGLVTLLLFWVASLWPEPVAPASAAVPAAPRPAGPYAIAAAAAAAVAIAACGPLLAAALPGAAAPPTTARLAVVAAPGWVAAPTTANDWRATHAGAPLRLAQSYRVGSDTAVSLQLVWYPNQSAGAELLTAAPDADRRWHLLTDERRRVALGARTLTLRQSLLQGDGQRLLVWRWYRQSGVDTSNAFLVKLLLARSRLLHGAGDGAEIIVAAPFDGSLEAAERTLRDFLASMLPAIEQGLNHAARR